MNLFKQFLVEILIVKSVLKSILYILHKNIYDAISCFLTIYETNFPNKIN